MEKTEGKKKEYNVNFGMSEELMNYMNNAMDRMEKQMENKPEKIGNEVKQMVVDIVKREMTKIDETLSSDGKITDDKWFKQIEKLDKLADLIRWM